MTSLFLYSHLTVKGQAMYWDLQLDTCEKSISLILREELLLDKRNLRMGLFRVFY